MVKNKHLEKLADMAFNIAFTLDRMSNWQAEIERPEGDGIYTFERGSLKIEVQRFYDRPQQVTIKWGYNNEVFFCDENQVYEDDKSRPYQIFQYRPGIWEKEIVRWNAVADHLQIWDAQKRIREGKLL